MIRVIVIVFFIALMSCNSTAKNLKSGQYEYLTLITNNNEVYGLFEYYDKWNSNKKVYENVSVFYLYGIIGKNDTIKVQVGYLGDKTNGSIVLHNNDSITLFFSEDFTPGGYGIASFENEGYTAHLTKELKNVYIGLGIVKNQRAYFYDTPFDNSKTESFIIAGDCVQILQKQNDWLQIVYFPINVENKKYIKWIKTTDIYDKNPLNW